MRACNSEPKRLWWPIERPSTGSNWRPSNNGKWKQRIWSICNRAMSLSSKLDRRAWYASRP
ncbi:hypothetical protein D3C76_1239040 [compost metagenome]